MRTKIALLASTTLAAFALAAPAEAAGGWYVSLTGGANWVDDNDFFVSSAPTTLTWNTEADTGFIIAGAVGMYFGDVLSGLRGEVEFSWRSNNVGGFFTSNVGPIPPTEFGIVDYDHQTFSVMANAWFDIPMGGGFSPYVGGGIGWADTSIEGAYVCTNFCTVVPFDFSDDGFAWQLGAGVNFNISPNVQLGVGYRFFQGPEPTALSTWVGNTLTNELENDNHSVVATITFGM